MATTVSAFMFHNDSVPAPTGRQSLDKCVGCERATSSASSCLILTQIAGGQERCFNAHDERLLGPTHSHGPHVRHQPAFARDDDRERRWVEKPPHLLGGLGRRDVLGGLHDLIVKEPV